MSIQDFKAYLQRIGVSQTIFPLAFPAKAPFRSILLEVGEGFESRGSVRDVILTLTVKGNHPEQSEAVAQDLNTLLKDRTDDLLTDNCQIVFIKSQQLIPAYLGKDAEGSHYSQVNFRVLVNS